MNTSELNKEETSSQGSKRNDRMSDRKKNQKIKEESRMLEDFSEELFEAQGGEIPSVGTMLKAVVEGSWGEKDAPDNIKKVKAQVKETVETSFKEKIGKDVGKRIEELEKQAQHQLDDSSDKTPPKVGYDTKALRNKAEGRSGKKRIEWDEDDDNMSDAPHSYASVHEIAEIRDDIDRIDSRMESIETRLELLINERSVLPGKLKAMREETNAQLTLILDKMSSVLESNVAASVIQSSAADLISVKTAVDGQMGAAISHVASDLSPSSPFATEKGRIKQKKRFVPMK
jgi:archaellum component FlaC